MSYAPAVIFEWCWNDAGEVVAKVSRSLRVPRKRKAKSEPRPSRARSGKRGETQQLKEELSGRTPYLGTVQVPSRPQPLHGGQDEFRVATYNVHRWMGLNGRGTPDPAKAAFVISELGADVLALQEVLRPFHGDDPLLRLAEALQLYVAFGVTRIHSRGELGNAILSRWPMSSATTLDLSFTRIERRAALAVSFEAPFQLSVVATHLALVDRTRHQQVETLLGLPQVNKGATLLLGDMNTWRRCKATKKLEKALADSDQTWPLSFPSTRPILALDRIYAQGAQVMGVEAHATPASHRASDHLPVVAKVRVDD